MEKTSLFTRLLKKVMLVVLATFAMSFLPNQSEEAYEALDDYKNIVFTLSLNKDNTYIYLEKFLDGSVWLDRGEYEKNGDKLVLTSSQKTKREHNYLKFSKEYKFKGDEFHINGDTLTYSGKGNQKIECLSTQIADYQSKRIPWLVKHYN